MKPFLEKIKLKPKIINHLETADEMALDGLKRLEDLYNEYQRRNIPFDIFKASIEPFEAKYILNLEKYGQLTLVPKDMKWIDMILEFRIFKLGSLRFQYFPMDYVEIERDSFDFMPLSKDAKEIFYENRPLINVHIQKDTDLTPGAVDDAFKKARRFFSDEFPDVKFEGFVTRTWLIYPGIVSLLKPSSNIYQFAKRFEVIASNHANYQALQRVYGTEDLQKIKSMPKTTSLAQLIFQNTDKLGVSFGFMPFNPTI